MATLIPFNSTVNSGDDGYFGIPDPDLSPLAVLASSLVVGVPQELSTPSLNVVVNSLRPNEGGTGDTCTDWVAETGYDPIRKRMTYMGAPAGLQADGSNSMIMQYDLPTNNYKTAFRNPVGQSFGHGYSGNAFNSKNGIAYKPLFTSGANAQRFDTWNNKILSGVKSPDTDLGISPATAPWVNVHGLAPLPNLGAEGSLIHINSSRGRVNRYDIATDTWSNLVFDPGTVTLVGQPVAHYHPITDVAVVGFPEDTRQMYTVDGTTGTITQSVETNPTNIFPSSFPGNTRQLFLADSGSNKSLAFTVDSNIHEFDTLTRTWSSVVMPTIFSDNNFENLADAVGFTIPEYNCMVIVPYGGSGTSKTFLYRHTA